MEFADLKHLQKWALLEVEWIDSAATTGSGWHEWDGQHLDIEGCQTVGVLGHLDQTAITLILSRDATTDCVYGVMTLPLSAVSAVHELKRIRSATRNRLSKLSKSSQRLHRTPLRPAVRNKTS